jgi:hypothetical protein
MLQYLELVSVAVYTAAVYHWTARLSCCGIVPQVSIDNNSKTNIKKGKQEEKTVNQMFGKCALKEIKDYLSNT